MARCLKCYPLNCRQSKTETQVFNFVKGIYDGEIIQGDRTAIAPRELDIYVPDLHIAIEYNGVAWHSEQFCTPLDYHLQKTIVCEENGIFLLHLFEIEWKYKTQQTKAFIERHLHHNQMTIDAYECDFVAVDADAMKAFYDENSFVFCKISQYAYGFKMNDQLLFCIQADEDDSTLVLHNMWFKIGFDITSALNRMIDELHNIYQHITIVIDRRLWPNNMINAIQYLSMSYSEPHRRYAVVNPKGCLVDHLDDENANLTYYTIYDSGDIVIDV